MKRLLPIIILALCTLSTYAQITVTGRVTDMDGTPLPGASVLEKGTFHGAITDLEGMYSLTLSAGAEMEVSFVGYQTEYFIIGDQTEINVSLKLDLRSLEEVVVVGYGTQKKVNVTGAVASVNSEEITRVPSSSINSILAGKLPGLIVDQNSGQPGDNVASVYIRGFGANNNVESRSAQNESALVIVDGMERSFSQLDPNEIESITILKDAAAAVYGIRGAAGVILVTTKKGKTGKPVFTYNSSFSSTGVTAFPEFTDWQGYLKGLENHSDPSNADLVIGDGVITPEREAALAAGDPGTDWWEATTRPYAPLQQHNLNVSGGTDNVQYYFSLGYLDEGTIWESEDYSFKRYNTSMNVDVKINEYLSSNVILGWRKENRSNAVYADFNYLAMAIPAYPETLPDPNLNSNVTQNNPWSPIAATNRDIGGFDDQNVDVLNGSIDLRFKVPGVKGLELKGFAGINQNMAFTKRLRRKYELYFYDGTEYSDPYYSDRTNDLNEDNYRFSRITSNLSLNYNRSFGDHSFNGLLLWEGIVEKAEEVTAESSQLLSPEIPYFYANNGDMTVDGSASEYGRTGVVGRINYDYQGKYLLEASFRRDESSYFPEESRVGWFPAVSLGWNLHKENFMSDVAFLSRLKIRGSASQLGNDGANQYDYIAGFYILSSGSNGNANGYVFDNQFQTGIRTLGIANPLITWQRSNIYNVGFESGFLDNRLSFEADVFYRYRFNLLASDPENVLVPGTSGAEQPLQNLESRSNRGLELIMGYKDNFGELGFNIMGNFSWAREKWETFLEPEEYLTEDLERIERKSGQWVNRTFGYVFDGFFADEADIADETVLHYGGSNNEIKPGDIKLKDINGDGLITTEDRVEIGRSGTPEIMFGLNTQFTWKGFDLTVFFQGASNYGTNFDYAERSIVVRNNGARVPFQYVIDGLWTPENKGEGAEFPVDNLKNNDLRMDQYWKEITYVRLKNLVIGYTLPNKYVSRFSISNLRVYLSGTNLLTFDNLGIYPYDPEAGDRETYPLSKVYTVGVNLSF
ncbi:MAG: TonB-dependent receptor [Bacteroidales bacterium]|nr:TonB-dependent receptor [Bacteroidales bacterium]